MDNEDEYLPSLWEIQPPYRRFVWAIFRSFGWYIIGFAIILIFLWPYVKKAFTFWKKKADDREYDIKYKKDVDHGAELLIKMQLAREKMQEQFTKQREIEFQEEQQKKEKKIQELLEYRNGNSSGYCLGRGSSSKPKLRGEDYNPLMGGGGGGKYVPQKRSCCKKGGGCG